MQVKIINKSENPLPAYSTAGSAGMDLRANISEPIQLRPQERILIPTGISIELPDGFEGQVRPRSGLALKYGVTVLNSPGTIDTDYTGEIKIILINHSTESYNIKPGDRIAQLVVAPYQRVAWEVVEVMEETERGGDGFGSTGVA